MMKEQLGAKMKNQSKCITQRVKWVKKYEKEIEEILETPPKKEVVR